MFAASLSPCLTLTAPTGMGQAERREWYAAAWRALGHLPADLIRRGAQEALRTADHPNKIVPAIIAYAEPKVSERRRLLDFAPRTEAPALVAPGKSQCTAAEAAEILDQYGLRAKVDAAPDRSTPTEIKGGSDCPGKVPTAADYKRLFGIDVEVPAA